MGINRFWTFYWIALLCCGSLFHWPQHFTYVDSMTCYLVYTLGSTGLKYLPATCVFLTFSSHWLFGQKTTTQSSPYLAYQFLTYPVLTPSLFHLQCTLMHIHKTSSGEYLINRNFVNLPIKLLKQTWYWIYFFFLLFKA